MARELLVVALLSMWSYVLVMVVIFECICCTRPVIFRRKCIQLCLFYATISARRLHAIYTRCTCIYTHIYIHMFMRHAAAQQLRTDGHISSCPAASCIEHHAFILRHAAAKQLRTSSRNTCNATCAMQNVQWATTLLFYCSDPSRLHARVLQLAPT